MRQHNSKSPNVTHVSTHAAPHIGKRVVCMASLRKADIDVALIIPGELRVALLLP